MNPETRPPYGSDVGCLIDDYKDFTIGGTALGYSARMRRNGGHVGRELHAGTLDALADKMDQARAAVMTIP
jgi:hypothetical protein